MPLVAFENLNYNGFGFPVETKLTINAAMKYDGADRTVVAVLHTLTAVTEIAVGGQEASLPQILALLEKPGQVLTLTGTGFGDLSVNGDNAKQDVAWGPKPRVVEWEPHGVNACRLIWRCEVLLPTCTDASYLGQPMAYNYEVQVSTDSQGYVTRTISGYLEIPQTRDVGSDGVGGDVVNNSAINFWNASAKPPIPNGFRRFSNVSESADRRRLNFTVTDTEMADTILPVDVVECKASHTVQIQTRTLARHTATIRASYTMRKSVNKTNAFTLFLILVKERLTLGIGKGMTGIIPMNLIVEDSDIYGRNAGNFSFTYTYSTVPLTANGDPTVPINRLLQNLVPASALWGQSGQAGAGTNAAVTQSPFSNNYATWAASMNPVFGPGSEPAFRYQTGQELIVDLCGPNNLPNVTAGGTFFIVTQAGSADDKLAIQLQKPLYMRYNTLLRVITDPQVHYKPALPDPGGAGAAGAVGGYWGFATGGVIGGATAALVAYYGTKFSNKLVNEVQLMSADKVTVRLYFDLVRAGAEPVEPLLISVGKSAQIYRFLSSVDRYIFGNFFGVEAVGIRGWRDYVVLNPGSNLPAYPPDYYVNESGVAVQGGNNVPQPLAL